MASVSSLSQDPNTAIENRDYSSLPVISYGKHTILGKIWSGLFGGANNEIYTGKFNSKNRVKVRLYNRNFVAVKSLGLSVDMQKRNWIGWSGKKAEELRLGWEGISFNVVNTSIPGNPYDALKETFALLKSPDYQHSPNWDRTRPPFVAPDPLKLEINLLPFDFSLNLSSTFKTALDGAYTFANQKYGRKVSINEQASLIVWMDKVKKESVVIATPAEFVLRNRESININVKRYTDLILSYSMTGNNVNWVKNAIETVKGTKDASKIEMQFASIYGVAKYGGKWMGARIDKKEK